MTPNDFYNENNIVNNLSKGGVGHFPIRPSSFYAITTANYQLQSGEDLYMIAEKIFGKENPEAWFVLADLNNVKHSDDWKAGDTIVIPEIVTPELYSFRSTRSNKRQNIFGRIFNFGVEYSDGVCDVPAGVAVTAAADGGLFSWSASDNAIYYIYEYKIGVGGTPVVGSTFDLSVLLSNTDFRGEDLYFRVKAVCLYSNSSAFSDWVNVSVPSSYPSCASVSGISVTVLDNTSISVSITSTPNAYTIGYRLFYQLTGNVGSRRSVFIPRNNIGSPQFIYGLTSATEYEVFVASVCSYNGETYEGSASSTSTITTAAACGVMSGFSVAEITNSTIKVKWNAVTGVGYRVRLFDNLGNVVDEDTTTELEYTFSDLNTDALHTVSANVICAASEGSVSSISVRTTTAACPIPTLLLLTELSGVVVEGVKYRRVQVRVTAGIAATSFRYYRDGTLLEIGNTNENIILFADNDWNDTETTIGVQSVCGNNVYSSILSTELALSKPDPTIVVCSVPAIQVVEVNPTSLSFIVTGYNEYTTGIVIQYKVSTNIFGTWLESAVIPVGSLGSPVVISGLASNRSYDYRVKANCASGETTSESAYSAAKRVTTANSDPSLNVCPVVSELVINSVTETSAWANWVQASNATGYILRIVRRTDNNITDITISEPTTTSYQFTGLTSGLIYDVSISTVCDGLGSSSPFSESVAFNTNEAGGGGGGGDLGRMENMGG